MFEVEHLAAFVLASIAVIVVPGPATLFVSARASLGSRHAAAGALGIVFGDVVLMAASGLGLASLVAQWPALFAVIRVAGALYIGWLGVSAIVASRSRAVDAVVVAASVIDTARQGLLLTLINPKPILFFAAFFPLFIARGASAWAASYAWLGLMYEGLNVLYYAALILLLATMRKTRVWGVANPQRLQVAGGIALLVCATLVLFSSGPPVA